MFPYVITRRAMSVHELLISNIEQGHRCYPFWHVLESGAASQVNSDQDPVSRLQHGGAFSTTSLGADFPHSLGQGVAFGRSYYYQYRLFTRLSRRGTTKKAISRSDIS